MSFIPLGKTLHESGQNKKTPLKGQVEASQILEYAYEVMVELFGREQAYHIKPLFLKHRTLTVACANSTTAGQIQTNQATIVGKINEKLGKKEVDAIRYLL